MISGELPVPSDLAARIAQAEYARLLDYPDRRIPAGRARQRADAGRDWYEHHGRPWAFARVLAIDGTTGAGIRFESGAVLTGQALGRRLGEAGATALVVAAVSAGTAVDERATALWRDQRPDEAYFLDRFAAAVVEHLASWAGRHLRSLAFGHGLGTLPGLSPGNEGWDLGQQTVAAQCLTAGGAAPPPRSFEVLPSGMIRPKSSLLTVFGMTPRLDSAEAAWRRQSCSRCSLTSCGFRRVRVASGPAPSPLRPAMAYDPAAEQTR